MSTVDHTTGSRVAVVVVLPSGALGDRLLGIAREWTETYLLNESVWVIADSELAQAPRSGPPMIPARLIGRHAEKEVELFSYLADSTVDLIRLVALRCISPSKPGDSAIAALSDSPFVNLVREYIDFSRALGLGEKGEAREQMLTTVNLIVAPTERDGTRTDGLVEPQWQRNVVASPEDRARPDAADGFIHDSQIPRFDRFAMAHAATTAGLWATTEGSIYDPGRLAQQWSPSVSLQRIFIRGILTQGLVFHSARSALERAVQSESPLLDPGVRAGVEAKSAADGGLATLPMDRYDDVIARMVDFAADMDDARLVFRRPPSFVEPAPPIQGLLATLGQFSRFGWRAWLSLPRWSFNDAVERWGRRTQKILLDKDGSLGRVDARIDFGFMGTFISRVTDRSREIDIQRERGLQEASVPLPLGREDSEASVWRLLRQMSFAVLDGSEPPRMSNATAPMPSASYNRGADNHSEGVKQKLSRWWRNFRGTGVPVAPAKSAPSPISIRPPMAFPTDLDEAGRPRVFAHTDAVIPDTLDLWRPSEILCELTDAPIETGPTAGPFDISWFVKWRDHLEEQLIRFEKRLRSTGDLLERLQSALVVVVDQLDELIRRNQDSDDLDRLKEEQDLAELLGEVSSTDATKVAKATEFGAISAAPRVGIFRRILRALRLRRPQVEASVLPSDESMSPPDVLAEFEDSAEGSEPEGEATSEEDSAAAVHQQQALSDAQSRKERLDAKITEIQVRLDEDRHAVDVIDSELAALKSWLQEREASFAFRLVDRLHGERRSAENMLAQIVDRLRRYSAPDNVTDQARRRNFQQNRVADSADKSRRKFVVQSQWAWLLAGVGVYFLLHKLFNFSTTRALIFAAVTFLLALLLITIWFFRRWLKLWREVEKIVAEMIYCVRTQPLVRNEKVRLAVIHPQVEKRFSLLAEVLYRPWGFEQRAYEAELPEIDELPMAVQFAAPSRDGNAAKEEVIVNEATTRVIRRGWRDAAYRRLLSYVNEVRGAGDNRFTVEFVDRSASALDVVLDGVRDGEAARGHGAEMLEEYAVFIQDQVIPKVLPKVRDLRTPVRAGVDLSGNLIEEKDERKFEWDDWLKEVMGPASPFSVLSLSNAGIGNRAGFDVQSWALSTDRIDAFARENGVSTIPGSSIATTPIEMAVRVDISGNPMAEVNQARIFANSDADASGEFLVDVDLDGMV